MPALILEADLADPIHAQALVDLVDVFARGPDGVDEPLPPQVRAELVPALRRHPTTLILLGMLDGTAAGAAVCFWGFSTFAAMPLLNIHDLMVLPEYQGRGLGGALLAEAERLARARGGCKLSLEVNDDNAGAKRLYERVGFGPWSPATLHVTKDVTGPVAPRP